MMKQRRLQVWKKVFAFLAACLCIGFFQSVSHAGFAPQKPVAQSHQNAEAIQETVFKYLFARFGKRAKIGLISVDGRNISEQSLQRLQKAGFPLRQTTDQTEQQAERAATAKYDILLSMKITRLRGVKTGYALVDVEVFYKSRGAEGLVENYATLRVSRKRGKWSVLGTKSGWVVGDA